MRRHERVGEAVRRHERVGEAVRRHERVEEAVRRHGRVEEAVRRHERVGETNEGGGVSPGLMLTVLVVIRSIMIGLDGRRHTNCWVM